MTWDDLKLRYARVTAKELLLVEMLLQFIEDRRANKLYGKLEYRADNNGVVSKGEKLDAFMV